MDEHFDPYHKWLGIPPKDQPPTYYRLLAIEPLENDPDVIENAAEQRMRHVRSLQLGQHQALSQKLLNEIATAKLCLLDPVQKKAYDDSLELRLAGPEVPAAAVTSINSAPSINTGASSNPSVGRSPGRRRAKSPVVQLVEIVAGGLGGLLLSFLLLSFLREEWDMLGIAKAVRGMAAVPSEESTKIETPPPTSSLENPPTMPVKAPPVEPPVKPPPTNPAKEQTPPKEQSKFVEAPSAKLPPLRGLVECTVFNWKKGDKPLDLGPAQQSFLVSTSIAGYFLGNGEWFRTDVDEQGRYRLRGGGVQPVGITITRVRTPYRAWFEDKVETFSWKKGRGRVKLIHQHDGFAVLAGVNGCFLGPEHRISLSLNADDGYWYLDGETNFDTQGHALVYRFKQPGKFWPALKMMDWKAGDPKQILMPIEEGLCSVSSISGAFKGYGESLNATADDDGHWHVWGHTLAGSTRGSFMGLRFDTPEMLALTPAPPDIQLAGKTATPMTESPPPELVKPKAKVPPPAPDAIAAAEVKLADLLAQRERSTLLAAAAEKRPADEVYVLLVAVRDEAAAEGDCAQAMRTTDMLAEAFELDRFEAQAQTLLKLVKGCETPESNAALARLLMQHLDRAVQEKKTENLKMLAETTISVARKGNETEIGRRATLLLLQARKQEE